MTSILESIGERLASQKPALKATSPSDNNNSRNNNNGTNMTDKLIDRMVTAALPTIDPNDLNIRIQRQSERPPFSVQLTSRNFRKMTSRVGIVYEIRYLANEFLYWKNPSLTLTILSVYSFICLNPRILITLPSVGLLLCIMVPAYTARHPPPPPSSNIQSNPVIACGPPLRPPAIPKPVPDFSREFFLNMVDTQNAMYDFVVVHDAIVEALSWFALFAGDETLSSFFFTLLTVFTVLLYLMAPIIYNWVPWRIIFMILGWIALACTYPFPGTNTQRHINTVASRGVEISKDFAYTLDHLSKTEFSELDPLEVHEVEVFEIQKFNNKEAQWNHSFYIDNAFQTQQQSPSSSLSEILPPVDWIFVSKNWELDYTPDLWVKNRHLSHLFKIDENEKWVYDKGPVNTVRRRRWINKCTRKKNELY